MRKVSKSSLSATLHAVARAADVALVVTFAEEETPASTHPFGCWYSHHETVRQVYREFRQN